MGRSSASLTLKRLLGLRRIFPSFQPSLPTVAAREDVADATHLQGFGFRTISQTPLYEHQAKHKYESMRRRSELQNLICPFWAAWLWGL